MPGLALTLADEEVHQQAGVAHLLVRAAALRFTPTSGAEGWVPSSGVVVVAAGSAGGLGLQRRRSFLAAVVALTLRLLRLVCWSERGPVSVCAPPLSFPWSPEGVRGLVVLVPRALVRRGWVLSLADSSVVVGGRKFAMQPVCGAVT